MRTRFDPLLLSETVLGFGHDLVALLCTLRADTPILDQHGWRLVTRTPDTLEVDGQPLADRLHRAGISAHQALHLVAQGAGIAQRWCAIDAQLSRHPRLPSGTRMVFSVYVSNVHTGLLEGRADLTCGGGTSPGRLILGAAVATLAERVALADKARRWSARSLERFTVSSSENGTHTVEAPGPRQALVADRFLNWLFVPAGTVRAVRDRAGTVVASHRMPT